MINLDPKQFSDVCNTPLGRKIWLTLIKDGNVIRMETATNLKKPAAQAISEQLLEEFGKDVKKDRVKQAIGFMIKQIMESKGYKIERNGVNITDKKNLFTKASRYSK